MTELPKATEVLLTSFTTTIGIVIASFFEASAFIDAKKKAIRRCPLEKIANPVLKHVCAKARSPIAPRYAAQD